MLRYLAAVLECGAHCRLLRTVIGVAWVLLVGCYCSSARHLFERECFIILKDTSFSFYAICSIFTCNTIMMTAFIITFGEIMEQLHLELCRLFLPSFRYSVAFFALINLFLQVSCTCYMDSYVRVCHLDRLNSYL